jgi:hypothetical protein
MSLLVLAVNDVQIPNSIVLRNVEIQMGGPYGVGEQSGDPSSCTFQVVNLPTEDEIKPGDRINLYSIEPGYGYVPRFTGRVYSRRVDWEGVTRSITTIAASGPLAILNRIYIGDEAWPAETDGDRLARILALAEEQTGTPYSADPGGVTVLARDVDRQPAGDLARLYATSGLGLLTDSPDGTIRYLDRLHAVDVGAEFALTPASVEDSLVVTATTETLVNDITVGYGTRIDGVERTTVSAVSPDSQTFFGYYGADFDSELDDAGDALDVANEYIYRNSRPGDTLPTVTIDQRLRPDLLTEIIIGDVCFITGLPQPVPNFLFAVITSYRETWATQSQWQIELELVDGRYWGRGTIWDDVDVGILWNNVDPGFTWNNVGELINGVEGFDRWTDTPANYFYDNIPATAWADWTG